MGETVGPAAIVSTVLDEVFERITVLRHELALMFAAAAEDPLTRKDLVRLEPRVLAELSNRESIRCGMGVIMTPGVLMDATMWIEWWVRDSRGDVRNADFDFNENSLDFYDYTVAEWFMAPRRGVERSLVGPYVDFNGVDDYIVTATSPLLVGDQCVAVVGSDLRVDTLERRLYGLNGVEDVLVANTSDRVIVSTSPEFLPGSVFRQPAAAQWEQQPLKNYPWRVAIRR